MTATHFPAIVGAAEAAVTEIRQRCESRQSEYRAHMARIGVAEPVIPPLISIDEVLQTLRRHGL